jgi:polyhydroxybutyrate depolymerase
MDTGVRAQPPHDAAKTAHDGSSDATDGSRELGDAGDAAAGDAGILGARPYTLHVPSGNDPSKPTPLVVMFHGYGTTGAGEELYFQLAATSDANGFLYAYGNGLVDSTGNRFWNATNACCDFDDNPVDDVAYFDAIVADVKSKYSVDPDRVFAIGHSNGGFMAHRLACDRSGTIAAIVSLAGAVWDDPSKCTPTALISVAEVHGNADMEIGYDGGTTMEGTYPSAPTTVATWAAKNGCSGALAATDAMPPLDSMLPTVVQAYGACPAGIDVELWTIQGGAHIPGLSYPGWGNAVWSFLSAHPKH